MNCPAQPCVPRKLTPIFRIAGIESAIGHPRRGPVQSAAHRHGTNSRRYGLGHEQQANRSSCLPAYIRPCRNPHTSRFSEHTVVVSFPPMVGLVPTIGSAAIRGIATCYDYGN